jgi:hypothetical protein
LYDGPFDFNTRPWLQLFYYYKLSGSRSINGSYGAPINNRDHNFRLRYSMLNLEEGDAWGMYFNYDASGRIKRVGFAYMTYNRFCFGTRRRIADFTTSGLIVEIL